MRGPSARLASGIVMRQTGSDRPRPRLLSTLRISSNPGCGCGCALLPPEHHTCGERRTHGL
jgi:hypothetical protein